MRDKYRESADENVKKHNYRFFYTLVSSSLDLFIKEKKTSYFSLVVYPAIYLNDAFAVVLYRSKTKTFSTRLIKRSRANDHVYLGCVLKRC